MFTVTEFEQLSTSLYNNCEVIKQSESIMDLVNKVAIITGSAQGLGKAFAARLLEVGVKVCISDVNQEKGEAALSELKER